MQKILLAGCLALLCCTLYAQTVRPPDCGPDGAHTNRPQYHYNTPASSVVAPAKAEYLLYPNPATDFFALDEASAETGEARTLHLYNLLGQRVRSFRVEKEQRYHIADLPGGLYLVQILNAKDHIITTRRMHKSNGNLVRP